jgi:hypothetical protein
MKLNFSIIAFGICNIVFAQKDYTIAAFYWPAYHHEERLDKVFPEGKGEWEAVYTGKPEFKGHDQPKIPLWGYIDESDPKVMDKKIETALNYGVNTFIFDWYWYDGKPLLESCLDNGFLKSKNHNKMKFYIMWANHTANAYWDRQSQDKSKEYWKGATDRKNFNIVVDRMIKYFKDPSYLKVDGQPVFSIYELSTFINGLGGADSAKMALDYFRKKTIEAGFPGLHLQSILWGNVPATLPGVPADKSGTQNSILTYFGFNSLTNYQWVHFEDPNTDYMNWGNKAISKWKQFDTTFTIPYFPQVSIGWDNNARFPKGGQGFVKDNKPEYFEFFLRKAKTYIDEHPKQAKIITINSWNEWAEGSYLEPDKTNGYGYLEAVKKVFGDK